MKRRIKIEDISGERSDRSISYNRKNRTIPRVQLHGKWLQAAGFNPGAHLELTVISPGVIELRVCGPVQLKADDFTTATPGAPASRDARRFWKNEVTK